MEKGVIKMLNKQVKSQKNFNTESEIRKEVSKWRLNDLEAYLKKHKNDSFLKTSVSERRTKITAETYARKVSMVAKK